MEQTNIYDYLGGDPLLYSIQSLMKGKSFVIEDICVSLNSNDIYEAESDWFHEPFKDAQDCYKWIRKQLNESILKRSKC